MIESTVVATIVSVVQNVTKIALALHGTTDQIKKGTRDSRLDFDTGDVVLKLDISLQKLLRWQKLWTGDATRSGDFWQRLWGQSGCISILELLAKIQEDCSEIEEATTRLGGIRDDAIKKRNIRRPSKLQKLPQWFRVALKRQVSKFEDKEIRGKVERLSYHVEQLWTLSEMSFRTHNGNPAEETQPLGEENMLLEELLRRRAESAALYRYCNTRDLDFDLEIDLFDGDSDPKPAASLASRLGQRLCYHLFTASSINPVVFNELLVVPLNEPELDAVRQDQIVDTEEEDSKSTDLALIASKSKILCLRDGQAASQSFFKVTLPLKSVDTGVKPEVLAAILEKLQRRRLLDVADRLPLVEKIRLAFKIVECGLVLLGTPWLSHLNSETLRRIVTSDFQRRFVLHLRCSEKPDENPIPEILLVRAQIFQIGVLLVEIALDRPSCSTGMEDLEFGSSTIPYVERSMGHRYKQACEFCLTRNDDDGFLLDQKGSFSSDGLGKRSASHWMLKQYYAEVFVRYVIDALCPAAAYLVVLGWTTFTSNRKSSQYDNEKVEKRLESKQAL
jgi:hypothetical protein